MRTAFMTALTELAKKDKDVFLLAGDVGFGVMESFAKRFPKRFKNVGVAEQNMTGIAAGLALSGKKVYTYSIANFPVVRCLEQIRNDICYHRLNVTVVNVGGGLTYAQCGSSHHGTEDIALMRALPNMTVVAPGDPVEAAGAVYALHKKGGPAFLRLQRRGDPVLHRSGCDFRLGKAITMSAGKDVTLVATGGILNNTLSAAGILKKGGISARVLSMHTVKPIDRAAILRAARDTRNIVTIEEHNVIGGLGEAAAAVLAESGIGGTRFKRIGVKDVFCHIVGGHDYLKEKLGLSPSGIANDVKRFLSRKR